MKLSANIIGIIACSVLIFVSLVGNAILIYCTWRCIARRLPTSFALIFSLAIVHLLKNLVVNTMNIISSAGIPFDSAACKVGQFAASLTTVLEIWFTLYIAVFYCVKLHQNVHPPKTPPNGKWRKHHLIAIFMLWIAGMASCCPYLILRNKIEIITPQNISSSFHYSFLYEECKITFEDSNIELFYLQIFTAIISLVPLVILVVVSFRIVVLLRARKKSTYNNIWIERDASIIEVLRASKIIISLMFLVTSLSVTHFILVCLLNYITSWYFTSTMLVVLFSAYSSICPYLLMLINYKISLKIKSLRSSPCPDNKNSMFSDIQKPVPENQIIED
ncbi:uncharacterized protein LOC128648753 [Bombina bombina]|uniref:uncharacterized protein LOC128648753 n=1 Tax=Bombina bombina TaxID=8345 RepID=UPI00235AA8F1|nr:uncharacterized protein LOC128648753 [Bombina bombina]